MKKMPENDHMIDRRTGRKAVCKRLGRLLLLTLAVLTAAGCCGCATRDGNGSVDGEMLKVMQFNIKVGNEESVAPRVAGLKRLIKERTPDIIGFQEVSPAWREQIDKYILNAGWMGVGEYRNYGEEGTPIYFRTDKYELVDSGTFWLSDTPDAYGSAFPDVNCVRIATWVKLRSKATGNIFVHVNTHLDHNGKNDSDTAKAIRIRQTEVLLRFVHSLGDLPVLLTGDLNQGMSSNGKNYKFYKLITGETEIELEDGTTAAMRFSNTRLKAARTVDEDHIASMTRYFDENDTKYDPAHQPIDYVFYTEGDFTPLLYSTFMPFVDGVEVSDHLGLYCEFIITAGSDQN